MLNSNIYSKVTSQSLPAPQPPSPASIPDLKLPLCLATRITHHQEADFQALWGMVMGKLFNISCFILLLHLKIGGDSNCILVHRILRVNTGKKHSVISSDTF